MTARPKLLTLTRLDGKVIEETVITFELDAPRDRFYYTAYDPDMPQDQTSGHWGILSAYPVMTLHTWPALVEVK